MKSSVNVIIYFGAKFQISVFISVHVTFAKVHLLHDPEARAQRYECRNVLSVRRFLWKSTYSYWYYYSTLFMYHVAVNKIFCSIIPWPVYWYLHSVHEILIAYCCKLCVSLTELCEREIACFLLGRQSYTYHSYLSRFVLSVRCLGVNYPLLSCVLCRYGKYL